MQWPPETEQRDLWERHVAVGQVHAGQVALEVVDADDRHAPSERQRLGRGDADEEGADEARSRRHPHRGQVGPRHAGLVERPADDLGDHLDVGTAGQLGDHTAERGVQVDLARHDRRAHRELVSSTTAAAVSSHDVSMARSSRVMACRPGRLPPRPAKWPLRARPPAAPAHVHQGGRHVLETTAVDDQIDGRAQARRHVERRSRRRRSVGVRARDHEHARPGQQRAQEVMVRDADRHLVAPGEPVRSPVPRSRSRRPWSTGPATSSGRVRARPG